MKYTRTLLLGLSLSLFVGALGGCSYVTQDEFSQLRADIDRVQLTAEQALSKANEAQIIASDSSSRSKKTQEALNRGFKKSMYK